MQCVEAGGEDDVSCVGGVFAQSVKGCVRGIGVEVGVGCGVSGVGVEDGGVLGGRGVVSGVGVEDGGVGGGIVGVSGVGVEDGAVVGV